jgi:hypothetical protein
VLCVLCSSVFGRVDVISDQLFLEFEVVFVCMQEKIRRKAAGLKNPTQSGLAPLA